MSKSLYCSPSCSSRAATNCGAGSQPAAASQAARLRRAAMRGSPSGVPSGPGGLSGSLAGVDAGRRALQKPTRQTVDPARCEAEAPLGINPAPHDLGFLLLVTRSEEHTSEL